MFCDIYNLGRGPVTCNELQKVFGVNNLQVLEGYAYERIPKAVLAYACGPLGKWNKDSPEPPLLEITHHHEGSKYWCCLPAKFRTPDIKLNGTAGELEPVPEKSRDRIFFPESEKHPMQIKRRPNEPVPAVPDLAEILPEFVRNLSTTGLSPRPIQRVEPRVLKPTTAAAPKITDMSGSVLLGDQEVAIGIVTQPQPEKSLVPVEGKPGDCLSMKANGSRCQRPATMDGYCGYHANKR